MANRFQIYPDFQEIPAAINELFVLLNRKSFAFLHAINEFFVLLSRKSFAFLHIFLVFLPKYIPVPILPDILPVLMTALCLND